MVIDFDLSLNIRIFFKSKKQDINNQGRIQDLNATSVFFAKDLFWTSGDNLGLKYPAKSCKRVAFAAGIQKKLKRCRALKVAKRTLNLIQRITQFEMFFLQSFCQTFAMTLVTPMEGDYFLKSDFFSKYLSVTHLLSCSHLQESSQQPQLQYHIFEVDFEKGLLPPKMFLSVASSEAVIQNCYLMKCGTSIRRFSFKIVVLNIFKKFREKHQQQSSYSAQLSAFNMCSVINDFLGIS